MNCRQQARSGIDTSLLVVASIIVVAYCSLIRDAAARFVLPAHHSNQYGESVLAADKTNQTSIDPAPDSNPWWRRKDEYGAVVRCNTSASISRRFAGTCGLAPRNPISPDRIFNGKSQKYGEWPSYVRILGLVNCGGTLVSDRHVLTAAHCLYLAFSDGSSGRVEPSEMKLKHAVHSLGRPSEHEKYSRAKSICIAKGFHPRDRYSNMDDWALIELEEPIAFNDYIQPACLPEEPIQTKGGTSECWVVGAGLKRDHPNKVSADYVQKLAVKQVSCDGWKTNIPELKIGNPKLKIFDGKHACYANYGEPVGSVCPGDSGGPVLCLDNQNRWTVVALASAGIECTDGFNHLLHLGAVYTDMKSLLGDVKAQCGI